MTATAPHDAFHLASQLLIVDAQIQARGRLLREARERDDKPAIKRLVASLDRALDERSALTRRETSRPA